MTSINPFWCPRLSICEGLTADFMLHHQSFRKMSTKFQLKKLENISTFSANF